MSALALILSVNPSETKAEAGVLHHAGLLSQTTCKTATTLIMKLKCEAHEHASTAGMKKESKRWFNYNRESTAKHERSQCFLGFYNETAHTWKISYMNLCKQKCI